MRKKFFAVIMSTMMMITFMPSMAFAAEPAADPALALEVANASFTFASLQEWKNYGTNTDGSIMGTYDVDNAVQVNVDATTVQGNAEFPISGSTGVNDVTLYASLKDDRVGGETKRFNLSESSAKVTFKSDEYVTAGYTLMVVPVVKGSAGVEKFTGKVSLGTSKVEIPFDTTGAVATIGSKYYNTYAGISADAKSGNTIKVLSTSAFNNVFGDGTRTLTFDCVSAEAFSANTTVAKGCTLKNAELNTKDLTLEEGAAVENVNEVNTLIVNGKNVKVTSAEAGTIEVSGSAVFAGKLKTGNISVKANSTADISRIAKEDLTCNGSAVTLVSADSKFIPNNDERWVKDTILWILDGVYVCNGKTYKTGNALWNEVSGSSSVAVKVIGEGSDNFTLAGNQTLTLDGISGSKFSGTVDTTSAGAKLVINSGIYANENLLAPSSDGYLNVKAGGKKGAWSAVKKIKTK